MVKRKINKQAAQETQSALKSRRDLNSVTRKTSLRRHLSRCMKDLPGLVGVEGGSGRSSFQRDEEQMPTSEGQIN